MVAPPLLVIRFENGASQVGRLLNGTTFDRIGSNLAIAVETPGVNISTSNARVIQYKNKLYAWQQDRIYRYDGPSGDWTEILMVPSLHASDTRNRHAGMHIVQLNDEQILVGVYRDVSNILRAFHYDGTTFSNFTTILNMVGGLFTGKSFVFRNSIYWNSSSTPTCGLVRYDPLTNVGTQITANTTWVAGVSKDFCVFNGDLYGISPSATGGGAAFELKKLVGAQFEDVVTTPGTVLSSNDSDLSSAHCLFTDGTEMYLFVVGQNNGSAPGTMAVRFTPSGGSFTPTDITSTVVPVTQQPGSGVTTSQWFSFIDNDTDAENPRIHIWSATPNSDGALSHYEWNGPLVAMDGPNLGPQAGLSLPHVKDGGGEYIWSPPGEPNVEITTIESALDSQKISFIVHGDGGTDAFKVRFFFDDNETLARTPVTLLGPITGGGILTSDSTGDFIDDIVDDGVTIHTVFWDVVADGLPRHTNVMIMPTIFL